MAIIEAYSLSEVTKYLCSSSLLVLDLDNTVIESKTAYGSLQWCSALIQAKVNEGLSEIEAVSQVIDLWEAAQHQISFNTVEPFFLEWFELANQTVKKNLALTGRSSRLANQTLTTLNNLGVQFQSWDVPLKSIVDHEEVHFENGVLFVGPHNDKGCYLKKLLEASVCEFDKIIFVDDSLAYLNEVNSAASELGVDFFGIRYGAADEKVKNLDFEQVAIEQAKLMQL